MANVRIQVEALANFTQLKTQLAELKAAMVDLSRMPVASEAQAKAFSDEIRLASNHFDRMVTATRAFNIESVRMTNNVDQFATKLEKGQVGMGQAWKIWRQEASQGSKILDDLTTRQTRLLKSVFIKDPNQQGYAKAITATSATVKELGATAEATRIRMSAMNSVMREVGTGMINFGKNTQWAGRQLTVGLTMPLAMFGAAAAKAYLDFDKQMTSMLKVYGAHAVVQSQQTLDVIEKQVTQLADNLARTLGVAMSDTVEIAKTFSSVGLESKNLINATEATARLMKLGDLSAQQSANAMVSMQNVFKLQASQVGQAVDFLNAAKHSTSTTMQDIIDAIPRVGPIIQQMGGTYKDFVAMLVSLKEAGVPAAQGANAIKSMLASIIRPTSQAKKDLAAMHVDLNKIATQNAGNVMGMVQGVQKALDALPQAQRLKAIEEIFGKFQFARVAALMDNLGKAGSQSAKVLALYGQSSKELAAVAQQELDVASKKTPAAQFAKMKATLQADIIPLGRTFLKDITAIGNAVDKLVHFFGKLGNFLGPLGNILGKLGGAGLTGILVAGPVIMLVGLFTNLVGQIFKGYDLLRKFRNGLADGGIKNGLSEINRYFSKVDLSLEAANKLTSELRDSTMSTKDAFAILNAEIGTLAKQLQMVATRGNAARTALLATAAAPGSFAQMTTLNPMFSNSSQTTGIVRPHIVAANTTYQSFMGTPEAQRAALYPTMHGMQQSMSEADFKAYMTRGLSAQWAVAPQGIPGMLNTKLQDRMVITGSKTGISQEKLMQENLQTLIAEHDLVLANQSKQDELTRQQLVEIFGTSSVKGKTLSEEQIAKAEKMIGYVIFSEEEFYQKTADHLALERKIFELGLTDSSKVDSILAEIKTAMTLSEAEKVPAIRAAMARLDAGLTQTVLADIEAKRVQLMSSMRSLPIIGGGLLAAEEQTALSIAARSAGVSELAPALGQQNQLLRQAAAIASTPKVATGGFITGPGGPTEDAIPAYLSNGEYVVKASSVSRYGTGMMDAINAQRFSQGGLLNIPKFNGGGSSDQSRQGKPYAYNPSGYAKDETYWFLDSHGIPIKKMSNAVLNLPTILNARTKNGGTARATEWIEAFRNKDGDLWAYFEHYLGDKSFGEKASNEIIAKIRTSGLDDLTEATVSAMSHGVLTNIFKNDESKSTILKQIYERSTWQVPSKTDLEPFFAKLMGEGKIANFEFKKTSGKKWKAFITHNDGNVQELVSGGSRRTLPQELILNELESYESKLRHGKLKSRGKQASHIDAHLYSDATAGMGGIQQHIDQMQSVVDEYGSTGKFYSDRFKDALMPIDAFSSLPKTEQSQYINFLKNASFKGGKLNLIGLGIGSDHNRAFMNIAPTRPIPMPADYIRGVSRVTGINPYTGEMEYLPQGINPFTGLPEGQYGPRPWRDFAVGLPSIKGRKDLIAPFMFSSERKAQTWATADAQNPSSVAPAESWRRAGIGSRVSDPMQVALQSWVGGSMDSFRHPLRDNFIDRTKNLLGLMGPLSGQDLVRSTWARYGQRNINGVRTPIESQFGPGQEKAIVDMIQSGNFLGLSGMPLDLPGITSWANASTLRNKYDGKSLYARLKGFLKSAGWGGEKAISSKLKGEYLGNEVPLLLRLLTAGKTQGVGISDLVKDPTYMGNSLQLEMALTQEHVLKNPSTVIDSISSDLFTRLPQLNLREAFAKGGKVFGQGGPTSDSIPAYLSNGEYVMSADAVKNYGTSFMDSVNKGVAKFAKGGIAGFAGGGGSGLSSSEMYPFYKEARVQGMSPKIAIQAAKEASDISIQTQKKISELQQESVNATSARQLEIQNTISIKQRESAELQAKILKTSAQRVSEIELAAAQAHAAALLEAQGGVAPGSGRSWFGRVGQTPEQMARTRHVGMGMMFAAPMLGGMINSQANKMQDGVGKGTVSGVASGFDLGGAAAMFLPESMGLPLVGAIVAGIVAVTAAIGAVSARMKELKDRANEYAATQKTALDLTAESIANLGLKLDSFNNVNLKTQKSLGTTTSLLDHFASTYANSQSPDVQSTVKKIKAAAASGDISTLISIASQKYSSDLSYGGDKKTSLNDALGLLKGAGVGAMTVQTVQNEITNAYSGKKGLGLQGKALETTLINNQLNQLPTTGGRGILGLGDSSGWKDPNAIKDLKAFFAKNPTLFGLLANPVTKDNAAQRQQDLFALEKNKNFAAIEKRYGFNYSGAGSKGLWMTNPANNELGLSNYLRGNISGSKDVGKQLYNVLLTSAPNNLIKLEKSLSSAAKSALFSKTSFAAFNNQVKASDPEVAKLNTKIYNFYKTNGKATEGAQKAVNVNKLYLAGVIQTNQEYILAGKSLTFYNAKLAEYNRLQKDATAFANIFKNAQAADTIANNAATTGANKPTVRETQVQNYIDSLNNEITTIQKAKDARDKAFQAQQTQIDQIQSLEKLQSDITRARASGDLLAVAEAQSAYNAEKSRQEAANAKAKADAADDRKIANLQTNLTTAEKTLQTLQQAAADTAAALDTTTTATTNAFDASQTLYDFITQYQREHPYATVNQALQAMTDQFNGKGGKKGINELLGIAHISAGELNTALGSMFSNTNSGLAKNLDDITTKMNTATEAVMIYEYITDTSNYKNGKPPSFTAAKIAVEAQLTAANLPTDTNTPTPAPGPTPSPNKDGGYIRGAGTSTSDSIPARLSNGEYVVKASAVSQYGTSFLDGINEQKFAKGGQVGNKHKHHGSGRGGGSQVNYNPYTDPNFHGVGGNIGNTQDNISRSPYSSWWSAIVDSSDRERRGFFGSGVLHGLINPFAELGRAAGYSMEEGIRKVFTSPINYHGHNTIFKDNGLGKKDQLKHLFGDVMSVWGGPKILGMIGKATKPLWHPLVTSALNVAKPYVGGAIKWAGKGLMSGFSSRLSSKRLITEIENFQKDAMGIGPASKKLDLKAKILSPYTLLQSSILKRSAASRVDIDIIKNFEKILKDPIQSNPYIFEGVDTQAGILELEELLKSTSTPEGMHVFDSLSKYFRSQEDRLRLGGGENGGFPSWFYGTGNTTRNIQAQFPKMSAIDEFRDLFGIKAMKRGTGEFFKKSKYNLFDLLLKRPKYEEIPYVIRDITKSNDPNFAEVWAEEYLQEIPRSSKFKNLFSSLFTDDGMPAPFTKLFKDRGLSHELGEIERKVAYDTYRFNRWRYKNWLTNPDLLNKKADLFYEGRFKESPGNRFWVDLETNNKYFADDLLTPYDYATYIKDRLSTFKLNSKFNLENPRKLLQARREKGLINDPNDPFATTMSGSDKMNFWFAERFLKGASRYIKQEQIRPGSNLGEEFLKAKIGAKTLHLEDWTRRSKMGDVMKNWLVKYNERAIRKDPSLLVRRYNYIQYPGQQNIGGDLFISIPNFLQTRWGTWDNVYEGMSYYGDDLLTPRDLSTLIKEKWKLGKRIKKAEGGYISGPGTGTSDSIPARLSNGEYVVKASAVSEYGTSFLDGINNQKFAKGGLVGNKKKKKPGEYSSWWDAIVSSQGRERQGFFGSGVLHDLINPAAELGRGFGYGAEQGIQMLMSGNMFNPNYKFGKNTHFKDNPFAGPNGLRNLFGDVMLVWGGPKILGMIGKATKPLWHPLVAPAIEAVKPLISKGLGSLKSMMYKPTSAFINRQSNKKLQQNVLPTLQQDLLPTLQQIGSGVSYEKRKGIIRDYITTHLPASNNLNDFQDMLLSLTSKHDRQVLENYNGTSNIFYKYPELMNFLKDFTIIKKTYRFKEGEIPELDYMTFIQSLPDGNKFRLEAKKSIQGFWQPNGMFASQKNSPLLAPTIAQAIKQFKTIGKTGIAPDELSLSNFSRQIIDNLQRRGLETTSSRGSIQGSNNSDFAFAQASNNSALINIFSDLINRKNSDINLSYRGPELGSEGMFSVYDMVPAIPSPEAKKMLMEWLRTHGVGKADGGYISGPGTGTSDSVPARLSNGEYVVKASAVSEYGTSFLDGINNQKFAKGGLVGFKKGGSVGKDKNHTDLELLRNYLNNNKPYTGKAAYQFNKMDRLFFKLFDKLSDAEKDLWSAKTNISLTDERVYSNVAGYGPDKPVFDFIGLLNKKVINPLMIANGKKAGSGPHYSTDHHMTTAMKLMQIPTKIADFAFSGVRGGDAYTGTGAEIYLGRDNHDPGTVLHETGHGLNMKLGRSSNNFLKDRGTYNLGVGIFLNKKKNGPGWKSALKDYGNQTTNNGNTIFAGFRRLPVEETRAQIWQGALAKLMGIKPSQENGVDAWVKGRLDPFLRKPKPGHFWYPYDRDVMSIDQHPDWSQGAGASTMGYSRPLDWLRFLGINIPKSLANTKQDSIPFDAKIWTKDKGLSSDFDVSFKYKDIKDAQYDIERSNSIEPEASAMPAILISGLRGIWAQIRNADQNMQFNTKSGYIPTGWMQVGGLDILAPGNKPIKPRKTFNNGGYIRGLGTGTSDSIPASLSNGEYVIKADSVSKVGTSFLDAINQQKFANGGLVSSKKFNIPTISSDYKVAGENNNITNSSFNDHSVYNITVNAANSLNAKEVADQVMKSIEQKKRSLGTYRTQGGM